MSAETINEYTLKGLHRLIEECHNPKLVNVNDSPNANTIYHIYNDGQITAQKGGWAYLQRSEFDIKPPIQYYRELCILFPQEIHNSEISYAVATEEDCLHIRTYMLKLAERKLAEKEKVRVQVQN
jgi:hypothetical protein